LEFDSDAIAVVGQPLTINYLPAGSILAQRNNPYHFARLPGMLREYASAVGTDIVGERPLFSIDGNRFTVCEAHYDDDGQPPFHSATGLVFHRVLTQTLAGKT